VVKKKIWPNFQRIIHKIVTKLSKIWIWNPGSGKNLFRIPDPGVKKAPDPGSGSATLIEAVLERGEKLDDTVVIMMLLCVAAQLDRSCAGGWGEAGRHCCNYDVALCCSTTR
jgi:hypothetical protein